MLVLGFIIGCILLGSAGQMEDNARHGVEIDRQIPVSVEGATWGCLSVLSTLLLVVIVFSLVSLSLFGR